MKNNKGITLIALIITILVMLILAAVTINLVVGEDGVISRAEDANIAQEKAIAIDEVGIAFSSLKLKEIEYKQKNIYFLDEYIMENKKMMNDSIKNGKVIDIAYEENDVTTVTYISKNNNEFLIQIGKNGKVSVIDGWIQNKDKVKKDGIILNVGDKVTRYESNGITDWYILGAEHGKLLLTMKENPEKIGFDVIGETNINEIEKVLNRNIKSLNDICLKYKNENLAENSRSIEEKDFHKITGFDADVDDKPTYEIYGYANIITYKKINNKYYYKNIKESNEFKECERDLDNMDFKDLEEITVIDNHYTKDPWNEDDEYKNLITLPESANNLLFPENISKDTCYWLGTKSVNADTSIVFGIKLIRASISSQDLYYSYKATHNMVSKLDYLGVRPVVVLKPEVQVSADGILTMPTN